MKFEEVFKLPLRYDPEYSIKVWTADNNMAFDFCEKFMYPEDGYSTSRGTRKMIVETINEEEPTVTYGNFTKEGCYILLDGKKLLVIRSWGYLTGGGGLGLPHEEAAKLQDDFADFIIEKLSQ